MAASANPERRALEWQALQLLCTNFGDSAAPQSSGLLGLEEIHFLDPVHRALFAEISRCRQRGVSREDLRRRLPEAMTRLGWPDLDFDSLFTPPASTDIASLLS